MLLRRSRILFLLVLAAAMQSCSSEQSIHNVPSPQTPLLAHAGDWRISPMFHMAWNNASTEFGLTHIGTYASMSAAYAPIEPIGLIASGVISIHDTTSKCLDYSAYEFGAGYFHQLGGDTIGPVFEAYAGMGGSYVHRGFAEEHLNGESDGHYITGFVQATFSDRLELPGVDSSSHNSVALTLRLSELAMEHISIRRSEMIGTNWVSSFSHLNGDYLFLEPCLTVESGQVSMAQIQIKAWTSIALGSKPRDYPWNIFSLALAIPIGNTR